jgi:hypothetical protein
MKISFHEPLIFLLLHGAIMFIGRPIFVYLNGYSSIITSFKWSADYSLSFAAGLISYFLFITFYILGRGRRRGLIFNSPSNAKINTSKHEVNNFRLALGFIFGIFILLSFFDDLILELIFGSESVNRNGNSSTILTYSMFYLFSIVAVSVACFRSVSQFNKVLIFVIGVPALMVVGFFTGSKTLFLLPVFLFIFLYSARHGGISLSFMLLIFLGVLATIPIADFIRHNGQAGAPSLFEGLNSLLSRSYGTDILHVILRHHLDGGKYLMGESFALIAVAWIPRVLWENKPIISFGFYVSETYLPPIFAAQNISAAPTIIGELFANFSFLGFVLLPVIAFFFGRLVRFCLNRSPRSLVPFIWLSIFFSSLIFIQEASLSSVIFTSIVFLFISYFTSICFLRK